MEEIINFYGKKTQCNQAMEECGELIVAINKCLRYPNNDQCRNNLIEEMADVTIMLEQLSIMFEIDEVELQSIIDFKEARIFKRLRYEKSKREKVQQYGS